MSLCVLDEDKFHLCCQLFLQLSEQLGDGWSWEGGQEGYLRKTALRSVVIDSSSVWDYEGGGADTSCPSRSEQQEGKQAAVDASADTDRINGDMEDEDDGVCVASAGSSQLLQYEYHILHSCSYSTPVLYFRACTQAKTLEVPGFLHWHSTSVELICHMAHIANAAAWLHLYIPRAQSQTALCIAPSSPMQICTNKEHPLLGQPFFMLHPCRTEEFMRPVLQAAQDQHRPVNYVLSWLSVMGPVVGLDVPLKYSTLLHPEAPPGSTEPG
ncbi:ubiquitin-like-conjugating enzyme ATG10 [Pseudochaenichthys georgianus]|uniref:ubiquitin-like-conjugating enzyme ATG10 n=1 Tax=Pseudochaenichthys georgianus TaxID=52239 RepID=UPI0039C42F4B